MIFIHAPEDHGFTHGWMVFGLPRTFSTEKRREYEKGISR